ncbi:MAG: signal peptidase II [Hespellia sp.]|nr:signal peptidase II [Hespellia sp.]
MLILLLMSLTVILGLVDIVIKFWVESSIARGETREILDGKVQIRKVYNKGFALNLMEDNAEGVRIVSAYTTVILTIFQCLTLLRKKHLARKAGLSLMTAGAWSNTFDRWVRRYVVDYIGFQTKSEKLNRLTFNLGDFFIGMGSVLVLLSMIFSKSKRKKK